MPYITMRQRREKRHKKIKLISIILCLIVFALAGTYVYERYIKSGIEANSKSNQSDDKSGNQSGGANATDFSVPAFAGEASVAVNGNVPLFTDAEINTNVFENYSDLDKLGRCGTAYANVCKELMPTEERGDIGSVKPSGWHQKKYAGIIDSDPPYLYNRCHLIAFCLAGENANEKNLITGTRYMNVNGMLPWEEKVANYIDETKNHVLYRVTPDFEDDELVARGVYIEAYSVEDNGEGICFFVYCYNVQPGVEIDYATGKNKAE